MKLIVILTIIEDFSKEFTAVALKWWTLACWVIFATVAKIAGKIQTGEKITWIGMLVSAILAFTFGMFAAKLAMTAGASYNASSCFGILASLTSDKLFSAVISNWKAIWQYLLKIPVKNDEKKDA